MFHLSSKHEYNFKRSVVSSRGRTPLNARSFEFLSTQPQAYHLKYLWFRVSMAMGSCDIYIAVTNVVQMYYL